MTAAKYDIFIEQGSVFRLEFRWSVGNPSAVVNIASYKAQMQCRLTPATVATIFSLSTEGVSPKITKNIDNFFITVMQDEDTALLSYENGKKVQVENATTGVLRDWWRIGVYDFEVESAGGERSRLLYGNVYVSPEVTRT